MGRAVPRGGCRGEVRDVGARRLESLPVTAPLWAVVSPQWGHLYTLGARGHRRNLGLCALGEETHALVGLPGDGFSLDTAGQAGRAAWEQGSRGLTAVLVRHCGARSMCDRIPHLDAVLRALCWVWGCS